MNKKRMRHTAAAFALAAITSYAQAAEVTFTGGTSTDFSLGANWSTGSYPGLGDFSTIDMIADLTNATPNDILALRLGVSGTGVLNIESNGLLNAAANSNWDSHVGTSGNGTLNINGGTALINFLEVGRNLGAQGTVHLNSGTLLITRGSKKPGYSLHLGANDNSFDGGSGTIEISGGLLRTRAGVELGNPNGPGTGSFNVIGAGASEIGIGSQGTADGLWDQYAGSTLKLGVATNGITPILIDDTSGSVSANATFREDALLDVSFVGGHIETNFWTVMIAEGTMLDGGMIFAPGVDAPWGFRVTNDTLQVGYGLGWTAGNGGDIVPPSPGRTLYWTGAAGSTDPFAATNWVLDTALTPSTWGVYSSDNLIIGDVAVTDPTFVSEVDYAGGAPFVNQGWLSLGSGATGILNMVSGDLNFAINAVSTLGAAGGDATLNIFGGTLGINSLRTALGGAQSTINLQGGDLTIGRGWGGGADGLGSSIYLGYGNTGTGGGSLNILGGSLRTRGPVSLGILGDPGFFSVTGTNATRIGIGAQGTTDGAWNQATGSVLKFRLGKGHGVTPIEVVEVDPLSSGNGNVTFGADALLDVDWMPGVTNLTSFDVMTWDGSLTDNGLRLSPNVNQDIWSFAFVDTNADTTNDTLRVTAAGLSLAADLAGNSLNLGIQNAIMGAHYTLQTATDPVLADWIDVPSFTDLVATSRTMNVSFPLIGVPDEKAVYRMKRVDP